MHKYLNIDSDPDIEGQTEDMTFRLGVIPEGDTFQYLSSFALEVVWDIILRFLATEAFYGLDTAFRLRSCRVKEPHGHPDLDSVLIFDSISD